MNILYFIIWTIFLYLNIKIIYNDLKNKKIPNYYIIRLFILWIIFLFTMILYWQILNYYYFLLTIFVWFLVSFTLYAQWFWSAWDAKYLLVLSLFLPNIWIIPLICNIALITVIYLLIYFIYFYTKLAFNKNFRHVMLGGFIKWEKDRIWTFLQKNFDTYWELQVNSIVKNILWYLLNFILFFIFLRLLRGDILEIFNTNNIIKFNIWSYMILSVWLISIAILYIVILIKKMGVILTKKIQNLFWLEYLEINKLKNLNLIPILIILLLILIYDYNKSWFYVFHKIYLILTLHLFLYILIKITIFFYKLTYEHWEYINININNLEMWYIVDKNFLINIFWEQQWLLERKDFGKNTKNIIVEIKNPIDKEDLKKIKQIYKITKKYYKKSDKCEVIEYIRILKTFPFWGYIFFGFIISYIYEDQIWKYIINLIYSLFKYLIHN